MGAATHMRRLADPQAAGSFSNRARARRFHAFEQLVADLQRHLGRPVRILDVGGTNSFWEQRGWTDGREVEIVTVNIEPEARQHDNVEPVPGDARDLREFDDGGFDFVFSNSVIQYLRDYSAQAAMAEEVRRVAPRYWVQTPNYWFPLEPHFLTPGWQYLPEDLRVELLRRRRWGWRGPCPDPAEARLRVQEIRLMRRREMARLFPDARVVNERFGPLVKSFVAVRA